MDAPTRLRLTFGEVPGDVADDFYSYQGELSEAWLPDEVFNIDDLPQTVYVPRRHAFRYLKIQVIDTSPKYAARFQNIQIRTVTSAQRDAPALESDLPEILRQIDIVSLSVVFEAYIIGQSLEAHVADPQPLIPARTVFEDSLHTVA